MDYSQEIKETIEAMRREFLRLAEWFRKFSEADWAAPTFCPDGPASQVMGHITFGGEFFASSVRNGLKGDLGFPFGAKTREEFMTMRKDMAIEIGRLDGPTLTDRFEASTTDVIDLFASLDPADYEKMTWHRRRNFPIRRLILSRLNEYLLHEWDIQNKPSAPLTGPSVAIAARNLLQHCQLFYELSPAEGLSGAFAFDLTDIGYRWATRVEDGKGIDMGIGEHSADGHLVDATFSATAGDMLLLITGRLPVPQSRADGRLAIEGDEEKAETLLPTLFFPL